MVARFVAQCALVSLPIAVGLVGYVLWNRTYIPAPRLTANVALNEQVHRVARLPHGSTRILALGSSMTLNNLASAPVVRHFGTRDMVNAGAWGMGAFETALIGPDLVEHLGPSTVIMVMNLMDFQPGTPLNEGDEEAIREHLANGGSAWDYLKYWDSPWFLRQIGLHRIRFTDPGNYEYLGFDAHGAATLEVPQERILPARFNKPAPRPDELQEYYYEAFAAFSVWLRERDTDLIVLLSPYRQGLQNPELEGLNAAHAQRLRQVLEASGHQLVNGNERVWPDSMFNDSSHLDRAGAEEFTRWALERLR
jgi:hypothetical protein